MAEPAFWQYPLKLNREPICTEMIRKYDNLYIELTQFAVSGAEYCFPYFNPTGVDPATGKRHHLYTGQWEGIPVGLIDYENSVTPEFVEYKEKHENEMGKKLDDTIKKLRKRGLPHLHGIIWKAERDGILANAYLGTIYPGCRVLPHKGLGANYMRVMLGLTWDDDKATITVGDETETWTDGDIIAFRDCGPYDISIKHEGEDERLYLSFDLDMEYLKPYLNS